MDPTHPTVLAMRNHFFKYWKGATLSVGAYEHYKALVQHADNVLGKRDPRTLTLWAEYMYAAFYHRSDLDLTYDLALELW